MVSEDIGSPSCVVVMLVAACKLSSLLLSDGFSENLPATIRSLLMGSELIVWVPLGILVLVFVGRVLYAPYALYIDMRNDRDFHKKSALENVDKKRVRDDLAGFMNELNALKGMCRKNKGNVEDLKKIDDELSGRIKVYLNSTVGLGPSYLARYRSDAGIQTPSMDFYAGSFHKKLYQRIYWQVIRMEQFVNEFSR